MNKLGDSGPDNFYADVEKQEENAYSRQLTTKVRKFQNEQWVKKKRHILQFNTFTWHQLKQEPVVEAF